MWSTQNAQQEAAIKEIQGCAQFPRIVAVVGGSLLEQRLTNVLEARLRSSKKVIERMFKPTGPMGPFANKIHLAYLLHMYPSIVYEHILAISEIRNKFAHALHFWNFHIKELDDQFRKLTLHEKLKFYPHLPGIKKAKIEHCENRTQIFIVNLKILLMYLMFDYEKHMPESNQMSEHQKQFAAFQNEPLA
jgi:DNA-binding MltR family transcriptional regulator